jgi:hypothetical protein
MAITKNKLRKEYDGRLLFQPQAYFYAILTITRSRIKLVCL